MKLKISIALLLILIQTAPLFAQLEKLPTANTIEAFTILYQLREEDSAPDAEPRVLTEEELNALKAYLKRAAEEPYPHDPLHGVNRPYDLTVQWALELLGDDEAAGEYAVAIAARDDVPTGLRLQVIDALSKNDEALLKLENALTASAEANGKKSSFNLLMVKVLSSKENLATAEARRIASYVNAEDEMYVILLRELRYNGKKNAAYSELVNAIADQHPKSKLLEVLLIGSEGMTIENLKLIEPVIISAIDNRKLHPAARASVLLAARRLGHFQDAEFAEQILTERNEDAQETLLEESLNFLPDAHLERLANELKNESLKKMVQDHLREKENSKAPDGVR